MRRESARLKFVLVSHNPKDQHKELSSPQTHAAAQAVAASGPSHYQVSSSLCVPSVSVWVQLTQLDRWEELRYFS
jgi:hypothetical protein